MFMALLCVSNCGYFSEAVALADFLYVALKFDRALCWASAIPCHNHMIIETDVKSYLCSLFRSSCAHEFNHVVIYGEKWTLY